MNNPTDTNQASEDELREQLADKLEWYSRYRERGQDDDMDRAFDDILALIRTEKLKLLNELDKSMPTAEQLTTKYGYHMPEKQYGYKLALHDIREVLTKLEAEL